MDKLYETKSKIKLAILEDNINMLKGLCAQFDLPFIEICVASDTLEEFLVKVEKCLPDVAIIDLRIWKDPDAGFDAIHSIKEISPLTKNIIYTYHDSLENFNKAIRVGVKAFVCKEYDLKPKVSLVDVVNIVNSGGNYFDEELLIKFSQALDPGRVNSNLESPNNTISSLPKITKRQMEVLVLLDEGASPEEIAKKLVISINTVKAHTKNIREKFNVHTTQEAILLARINGILNKHLDNKE